MRKSCFVWSASIHSGFEATRFITTRTYASESWQRKLPNPKHFLPAYRWWRKAWRSWQNIQRSNYTTLSSWSFPILYASMLIFSINSTVGRVRSTTQHIVGPTTVAQRILVKNRRKPTSISVAFLRNERAWRCTMKLPSHAFSNPHSKIATHKSNVQQCVRRISLLCIHSNMLVHYVRNALHGERQELERHRNLTKSGIRMPEIAWNSGKKRHHHQRS